jgi:rubrerythrin
MPAEERLSWPRRVHQQMTLSTTQKLASTPEGRAYILTLAADAEANGEIAFFARLVERVRDPALHKIVRRHQQDEIRHAELLRACADRQGRKLDIPAELALLDRISRALGGLDNQRFETDADIMEAYLFLQVIEERAVWQYPTFIASFEPVDPETAAVFREIMRDEARHLRYCHAITRRYAPSPEVLAQRLCALRAIESDCYADNMQASLKFLFESGILPAGPVTRALLPVAARLTRGFNRLQVQDPN